MVCILQKEKTERFINKPKLYISITLVNLKMIPLLLRLKKLQHKDIARAQDIIIEELYKIIDNAVLHGGTAIWRCYQGNRFSEDIDMYLPDNEKINIFFENLEKRGFIIEKKKITENSLYSNLKFERVYVRFEALFKKVKSVLRDYETIDGNFITVSTLTPEELIKEKINAYLNRNKIRDLYDIFFLLRYVQKIAELKKIIEEFKNPIDEKELKILIFEGLVPDSKKMLEYIKYKV